MVMERSPAISVSAYQAENEDAWSGEIELSSHHDPRR